MKLFALADLHLSQGTDKPMDVFGELWRDHAARMADNWDRCVGPDDTVLLGGDLSWARNMAEAKPDLRWIGERPGRKILLRGNHDSWWSGLAKVQAALPACCEILQNNSLRAGEWVVFGARGWTAPDDPTAVDGDERIFQRELERLRLSVQDADRRFGRAAPRVAVLHFPPLLDGRPPSAVVDVLREAGARTCVYGHLHGIDHRLAVQGVRDGIDYRLVAADAVDFRPVEIGRRGTGS